MPEPVVRPYAPTRISRLAWSIACTAMAAQSSSGAKQVWLVAYGAAAEAALGFATATSAESRSQTEYLIKCGLSLSRLEDSVEQNFAAARTDLLLSSVLL